MEKKPDAKSDLLRRPLYLYSLPTEVLDTLVLVDIPNNTVPTALPTSEPDASESSQDTDSSSAAAVGVLACALCSQSFPTILDQRSHVRSDLHHYNLKQKMRGLDAVTEAEFEKLIGNLDESLSGSEGSESDSEEEEEGDGSKKSTSLESEGNVLAALLKRQAVLAERQRRTKSGDDDDDNDDNNADGTTVRKSTAGQPLLWFRSSLLPEKTYFGVYRALFTPEELAEQPASEKLPAAIRTRQLAPISGAVVHNPALYTGRHVFLCMIGGGHFAASIVALAPRKARAGSVPMNREATVLAHKTFHRYTTRRKQGGSQSANDNAKGAAHSAGSSLRRYNEQALVDEVRALLREWKALLDSAELLFVRATGNTNRRTLFGPYDGQVLEARDPRLRGFPFTTRRPTQNEMMRAFIELTRLKVGGGEETAKVDKPKAKTEKPKEKEKSKPEVSKEEETALLHTMQLQGLARRSKVPALLAYLQANKLSATDFRFAPADAAQNHHAPTLLHLAAAQNAPALVTALLVRGGADPTVRNGDGRTPFELAGDRATRDAFRVARSELGETAANWEAAGVGAPMTRAEAEKRDAREKQEEVRREAERRRAEEARLKAEAAAAAAANRGAAKKKAVPVGAAKTAQEVREEEMRGLTPDQRRRLERERRARAAEERMRRMQG